MVSTLTSTTQGVKPNAAIANLDTQKDIELLSAIDKLNDQIISNPFLADQEGELAVGIAKRCDLSRISFSARQWLLDTMDRMRHHPDGEFANQVAYSISENLAPFQRQLKTNSGEFSDKLLKILRDSPPTAHSPSPYFEANLFIEHLLGIRDQPMLLGGESRTGQPNVPTRASFIPDLVNVAQLSAQDTFFDIGSGSGQVIMLMSLFTPARIVGVEIDPEIAGISKALIARNQLERISVNVLDAQQADLSEGSVFFMNAPFFGTPMRVVMEKLSELAAQKEIRVILHGPFDIRDFHSNTLIPINEKTSLFHTFKSRN